MGTVARLSATQFTSPTRQNSIVLPHLRRRRELHVSESSDGHLSVCVYDFMTVNVLADVCLRCMTNCC